MNEGLALDFVENPPVPAEATLLLALDGYEGPIDLLLTLARDQKVDLARISILQLADQYLAFVAKLQRSNLELAADYLVMAAWLAYLKSRLLLPEPAPDDEPSAADMAAALTFQLQRLASMQKAGAQLMDGKLLNRVVFVRGQPELMESVEHSVFDTTLYDLLKAYADIKRREASSVMAIEPGDLFSVDEAIRRFEDMLGRLPGWAMLTHFLPRGIEDPLMRRSAMSAHFVASLELAKQGRIIIRQDGANFSPIFIRAAPRREVPDGA
jgi:segregation and condensation protein A